MNRAMQIDIHKIRLLCMGRIPMRDAYRIVKALWRYAPNALQRGNAMPCPIDMGEGCFKWGICVPYESIDREVRNELSVVYSFGSLGWGDVDYDRIRSYDGDEYVRFVAF